MYNRKFLIERVLHYPNLLECLSAQKLEYTDGDELTRQIPGYGL